jgi:4a-hydroxytetrahydrobiopterin dehydratase
LRPSPSFADNFARHFIESSAALQKKENNKMFRTLPRVAPRAMPVFAVTQALQTLPGWRVDGNETNCIEREFVFPDFVEAMKFMNAVAPVCESMQHHPCWENVYNRLKVKLCTHDAGNKVTEKDVALAKAMSETYARLHRKP